MSEALTEGTVVNLNSFESVTNEKDNLQERKTLINCEDKYRDIENKKKMISKQIQVDINESISAGDLDLDIKTETYWQTLAETKRIELEDALAENERLCKESEELSKKNVEYKKLLEESISLLEVFKDIVSTDNDTGIDVQDINDSKEEL